MISRLIKAFSTAYWTRRDPVRYARRLGVTVGSDCRFIGITGATFGSEPFLIRIGHHVTITAGVRFITHDGGVWIFRREDPDLDAFGPITVEENVFIGTNAVLMPGIRIGSNSIIAAGAIVTRDIPAGSVAAGIPARRIKSVEEYHRKLQTQGTRIRSLPPAQRRQRLLEMFPVSDNCASGPTPLLLP
jgi:UDP-3-O-[3-hydroxymyristoyl] glucosamine N-acyltransferase